MINRSIQDAMNEQIKNELYSAYFYLSLSAYCESINLLGFAHWMRVQSKEELTHAMKFYKFVFDRGGRVILQPIDQPPFEFQSSLDVFQQALKHEQKVTGMINNLYALAVQKKDYASQALLQWFETEQVEEERRVAQIVETLKMVGNDGHALFILDRELSGRAGSDVEGETDSTNP